MIWHFGAEDEFQSSKFPQRFFDELDYLQDCDTINKSRAVGAAIQFIYPTGYLRRREEQLEDELESEGVAVRESGIHCVSGDSLFNGKKDYQYCTKHEYADIDNDSVSYSLPQSITASISDAVDEAEDYHKKEKARFVTNAVLAFERSVFDSLLQRVETKEQLLREVCGDEVQESTEVFQSISDGWLFESVYEAVFEEDNELDLAEIDPENPIELPEDHALRSADTDLSHLKETSKERTGAFLSYLKSCVCVNGRGVSYQGLVSHFERLNPHYDTPSSFVERNVLDYLTKGGDGVYYISEDDAPSQDEDIYQERLEMAEVSKRLTKPNQTNRSIGAAIREATSERVREQVREDSGAAGYGKEAMAQHLNKNELQACIQYLVPPLCHDAQKTVSEKADVRWEDYLFYRDGDF